MLSYVKCPLTGVTGVIRSLYELQPSSVFQSYSWSSYSYNHLYPIPVHAHIFGGIGGKGDCLLMLYSVQAGQDFGSHSGSHVGPEQGSGRRAWLCSCASLCTLTETARTPFSQRSSLCCSSDFRCGKRRWQTLPKCGNPQVSHCSSTLCSWCCHSAAQRGLVCPLHLPDTSFLNEEKTTILPSC